MTTTSLQHRIARWLCAIALLAASGWAAADPPSRVARLAYVSGESSFSPAGEREWLRPVVNRPLITGDRLWVDRGGRAELQLGSAAVRLGSESSMRLLNLDDRVAQVELTQGTLQLRVRRLERGQIFEVDTPNLAFSIRRPGLYRIDVEPDEQITTVTVRAGLGAVYGEGRAFVVGERRSWRFYDTALRDYEFLSLPPLDELDRWAAQRERRWENSASRRHVPAGMIGAEDLDQYGTWRQVPDYGFVWVPRRVPANWAPYRDGHWAWVEPWGWTWVDDAPWGFAPSHYGRWAWVDRSWAWVPGPATARPVYAPALVAFVGAGSLQGGGRDSTVAWFPLGPREVYRPAYPVSREYFVNVNTSNTVVSNTVVANVYDNRDRREPASVSYTNRQIPGAVVAVLAAVFAQSKPVAREAVPLNRDALARAPVTPVAPVAPVHASIAGPAAASARPPEKVQTRPVVAQTPPPPAPVPFAVRQSALAAQPGKPLAPSAVAALKPPGPSASAAAPAPAVKVVKPTEPVAAPPPAPPASRAAAAAAGVSAGRSAAARPVAPASAPVPAPSTARGPAAPASATALPERPGRPGERRADERAAGPASAPPPATAPAPAPRAAPAAPVASAPSPAGSARPAASAPERAAAPAASRPAPQAARPAPPASQPVPARAAPSAAPTPPAPAAAKPAAPEATAPQRADARHRGRDEREVRPQRQQAVTAPAAGEEGKTSAAPQGSAPAAERKPPPSPQAPAEERKPPPSPPGRAAQEKPPAAPVRAVPPAPAARPVAPPAAAPAVAAKKEPPAPAAAPVAPRAEHAAPPGPPASRAEGRAHGPRQAASEPGEGGRRERRP